MKKKISLALAVAMATSVGATAMAAPANPFSDVPSKHWSYNAVQQLAKAGIVDGFNDGTFKGDKTITRYEMATIVARAMAKVDKADAQQKAMIDKLAAEYSTELQNLGVRVGNLEKKVGNITWTGYARLRMESTPSQSNVISGVNNNKHTTEDRTRVRLFMSAPLDDSWTFKGKLQYDNTESITKSDSSTFSFGQAYVEGSGLGLDRIAIGKTPLWLGQGLIADLNGTASQSAPNSIVLGKKIGDFNLEIGGGHFNAAPGLAIYDYAAATNTLTAWNSTTLATKGLNTTGNDNLHWASLTGKISSNLAFDASYLKDGWRLYKTVAGGLSYTGIENFTISGEYGKNSADYAKNDNGDAKAYRFQIKYKGANVKNVNTWGIWAAQKKVDNGFDRAAFKTDDVTLTQAWTNGIKGQEYGVEYVPFKNGLLTFKYENMKTNKGYTDNNFGVANKGYIGQLEVFF